MDDAVVGAFGGFWGPLHFNSVVMISVIVIGMSGIRILVTSMVLLIMMVLLITMVVLIMVTVVRKGRPHAHGNSLVLSGLS